MREISSRHGQAFDRGVGQRERPIEIRSFFLIALEKFLYTDGLILQAVLYLSVLLPWTGMEQDS